MNQQSYFLNFTWDNPFHVSFLFILMILSIQQNTRQFDGQRRISIFLLTWLVCGWCFYKSVKIWGQVFKERKSMNYFSNCFLTFNAFILVWYSFFSLICGQYDKSKSCKLAIVSFCINYICIKHYRMKYILSKSRCLSLFDSFVSTFRNASSKILYTFSQCLQNAMKT